MSHLKLYRFILSGHSHQVELFLSLLGLDVQKIKSLPGFVPMNPPAAGHSNTNEVFIYNEQAGEYHLQ